MLRRTGITALLISITAGITSTVLFAAAFQFRADQEPTRVVAAGATSAELFRWAAVLDLFGSYLATAVLAYVLWRQLRPRNPVIADLATLAAVGDALAGGAGAAALAVFGSSLMHNYTNAAATEQVVITAQFATLMAVVMQSIWQFLYGILIGAWWLGIGLLLRPDRPRLSRLTLILAAVAAVGGIRQPCRAQPRPRRSAGRALHRVGRVVDRDPGGVHPRTTAMQPEPALILIASDDATTAQVIVAWQSFPQEPRPGSAMWGPLPWSR